MEIVSQPHVCWRSLLDHGFQRRMRIKHSHYRKACAITRAGHPNASVIIWHVLQQTFDRVVGIRALIDCLLVLWIAGLSEHYKLSFRLKSTANVLPDDDVATFGKFGERSGNLIRL